MIHIVGHKIIQHYEILLTIRHFCVYSGYPLFLGRQIGIRVVMLNLLSWKEGANGFENLKKSNPSSLVYDGVVEAE